MNITRDRQKKVLTLSQKSYIDKVVERFGMVEAKHVPIPLASHFGLSSELCPKTQNEKDFMNNVPYKSVVGSLMYAMVSCKVFNPLQVPDQQLTIAYGNKCGKTRT